MVLTKRAKEIYREEGISSLIRKGTDFLREKGPIWILKNTVGSIIPTQKIKYVVSWSGFLTAFYFYLNRTTTHEQRAVLLGHYRYHQTELSQDNPEHRLIRYTHLLEKGLSTRESIRRDVFGESKAIELVENIQRAWEQRNEPENDDQLLWTIDVLDRYFELVTTTAILEPAEDRFRAFLAEIGYEPQDRAPRSRQSVETDPITFDDFEKLVHQRTSTRWFQNKAVPREELDAAVALAAQSPSACNRQSYEFRLYDDPDLLKEIHELPLGFSNFKSNIPSMVVLVGKHRAYYRMEEKNVVFIDASLAAMTFQYALETRGLASCTINWPAKASADRMARQKLGLDKDEVIITTMAVGYPEPDGMVPYSEKKDINKLRSYNKI